MKVLAIAALIVIVLFLLGGLLRLARRAKTRRVKSDAGDVGIGVLLYPGAGTSPGKSQHSSGAPHDHHDSGGGSHGDGGGGGGDGGGGSN